MTYKRVPKAFTPGEVPVGTLPAIEQANYWFTAVFQALAQANAVGNGVEQIFGPTIGSAVSAPVASALRHMEALWGAVDTLADEIPHDVEPWELKDALRSRDALVHLGWTCLTEGCEHRTVLRRITDEAPACPPGHDHRPLYAYQGGEDPEPF